MPIHPSTRALLASVQRRLKASRGAAPGVQVSLAEIQTFLDARPVPSTGASWPATTALQDARFQLLAGSLPGYLSVLDRRYRYLFVNHAYEVLYERSASQIVGLTTAELLGQEAFERLRPRLDLAFAGQPQRFETFRTATPTGGRDYEATYTLLPGQPPDAPLVLALITDLTSLRQAQDDLARSRTALEVDHQILRAFLHVDDLTACQVAAQVVSEALGSPVVALGGVSAGGAVEFLGTVGDGAGVLTDPSSVLRRPILDGKDVIGEVKVGGRGGGYGPAQVEQLERVASTLAPILKARAACTLSEAQRQDMQRQLFQAQKMEAVGRLAGGIAHDFNNLLQVILGYAGLVLDTLPSGVESVQDMAEVIQAGERARDLVKQLLAFGRHDQPQLQVVELDAVIVQATRMARRVIGADIDFQIQLDAPHQWVRANAGQLEQVLMNLCVNARDAMPAGGALRVLTRRCSLDPGFVSGRPWPRVGEFLQLSVIDEGEGLDAAVIDHIFEPFFTTKQVGEGTGLGLAMVYAIVSEHGGLVHATNRPEGGARFDIYLPVHDGEGVARAPQGPVVAPVPAGEGLVLLAEDNDGVRRFASTVLQAAGFTVLVATDGADALRQAQGRTIRLAVLDVVMPHMIGPEVAVRLRETRPNLPILFITGFDQHMVERYRERLQHFGQLAKPFTVADLQRRVHELLSAGVTASR